MSTEELFSEENLDVIRLDAEEAYVLAERMIEVIARLAKADDKLVQYPFEKSKIGSSIRMTGLLIDIVAIYHRLLQDLVVLTEQYGVEGQPLNNAIKALHYTVPKETD